MKYITHHRFKNKGLCGKQLNLPYSTELTRRGDFLYCGDSKVCVYRSDNGKRHFAIDEDGRGLERGTLTYAIAFSNRNLGKGYRFNEEERKLISTKYCHFIIPEHEYIIFNDRFFEAAVEELQEMANALKVKVKS